MKKFRTTVLNLFSVVALSTAFGYSNPPLKPVPICYDEAAGRIGSKDLKTKTVYLKSPENEYGAWMPLTLNPDSVVFKEGKPIRSHQIFIEDRVVRVRYRRDTGEIRVMEILRTGSPLN
jgi:hypothetical protein